MTSLCPLTCQSQKAEESAVDSTSKLELGCGLGRIPTQCPDTERHGNVPSSHLPPGVGGSCHPEGVPLLSFPISELV